MGEGRLGSYRVQDAPVGEVGSGDSEALLLTADRPFRRQKIGTFPVSCQ